MMRAGEAAGTAAEGTERAAAFADYNAGAFVATDDYNDHAIGSIFCENMLNGFKVESPASAPPASSVRKSCNGLANRESVAIEFVAFPSFPGSCTPFGFETGAEVGKERGVM